MQSGTIERKHARKTYAGHPNGLAWRKAVVSRLITVAVHLLLLTAVIRDGFTAVAQLL